MDGFELKLLLRALVEPPAGPLVLVAIGLALLLARRRSRTGLALACVGTVLLWALSSWAVVSSLAPGIEAGLAPLDDAAWRAAASGPKPPKAIVVLGGGLTTDGPFEPRRERLRARTVIRVLEGARVARMTGLPVLVSGGTAPWLSSSEAALMRRSMDEDFGLAVRWAEDRSRDTDENARLSAALLRADGIDSVVLVTHAAHMRRSRLAFENAGLTVLPAPLDWISGPPGELRLGDLLPSASAMEASWLLVHEWLGLAWYRLRGHA
ncbi:MAG TPA: YdcF family protein [Burkholderiaceae bacterium]|nr:YdcF family protein [Burkholderiaceae bacterium]